MLACSIRPANRADLAAVASIDAATNPLAWRAEMFAEELGRNDAYFVVAEASSEILGFAISRFVLDEAELLLIAVMPLAQRSGLGRQLLLATLEECGERRTGALHLEVRASNAAATALYRALGFRENGLRRRYYRDNGEDALLFEYTLGRARPA